MDSLTNITQLTESGTASGAWAPSRERRSLARPGTTFAAAVPTRPARGQSWTRSGRWRWAYGGEWARPVHGLVSSAASARGLAVAPQQEFELGSALPGYEIGVPLGCGSFGVVYAARHVRLDRPVAIKQLWPNLTADADARRRFAEEARVLASLDHPHVVRVYDYVERGACALVLELVRGGSLSDRQQRSRPSVSTACRLVVGLLGGLEHAHQHGVVHRDVKPANLLFTDDGVLKVADFGVAKIIDGRGSATATLTQSGCLVGTPAYMAPEQLNPGLGSVSPASDVWAAGAILYELLTGGQPLEPGRYLACAGAVELAGTAAPELPRSLADVVAVATAWLPAERYQSAAEFARHLERACQLSYIA